MYKHVLYTPHNYSIAVSIVTSILYSVKAICALVINQSANIMQYSFEYIIMVIYSMDIDQSTIFKLFTTKPSVLSILLYYISTEIYTRKRIEIKIVSLL